MGPDLETERIPSASDRPAPALRLFLLGRFEVVRAAAPIPAQAWRRRRPADLLKLVALAPRRALPRDAAIDALWPDKDPASGANNLRAKYRKGIGIEGLVKAGQLSTSLAPDQEAIESVLGDLEPLQVLPAEGGDRLHHRELDRGLGDDAAGKIVGER
jgi:hypothetical protein